MQRKAETGRSGVRRGASFAALAGLLAVSVAGGCANPTVQYHRQFDYLRRVGGEAIEAGAFEDAREHLSDASKLTELADATDLEVIDALTLLTRSCRELGKLDEALVHANAAAQVLARHRLDHGGMSSGVYGVGAAHLLERARLEIERGDFTVAEEALAEFVHVRGESGGDARESTEAQILLGELRLAVGLDAEARELFRSSLDQARSFSQQDEVLLGLALFRVAEAKLEHARADSAAALLAEARPEGTAAPPLRPGWLLLRGRIDIEQGNADRAGVRLEEALALLESDDPAYLRDMVAPARAVVLAGRVFESPADREALVRAVLRALAAADGGSPLRRMQAGRRAVELGQSLFDGGAWRSGLQLMAAGRHVIAAAVGGRPHDAAVAAQFQLAMALEARERYVAAGRRCDWLVENSDALSPRAREVHPERLLACGRVAVAAGDAKAARHALGRALMMSEEAETATPVLQLELLLRLAALAHSEARDAEEEKLFDRVLPFVIPGVYDHLEKLLVDAYGPYGRFQPSSAAARLAHAAARTYGYAVEAPQLQGLAEKLGAEPVPASR